MSSKNSITINLDFVQEKLQLIIDARRADTLFDKKESAIENNEARFQLVEGCYYDYTFSDSDFLFDANFENIIQPHTRHKHIGTLCPNIFVGTLSLPIVHKDKEEHLTTIELEVQSIKSGYRDDYRDMLALITEKCTALLLQANSPVSHFFDIDYSKNSETTLYQKFAFIKSVIGTDEFAESVHRIVLAPVTKWSEITESKDIRKTRRFTNANIKEFQKSGNRANFPKHHYLREYGLSSLPERMTSIRKIDSVDTPENRFIKHALETFLKFCTVINGFATKKSKLDKESLVLIRELESQLHHSLFKDISRPTTLKLNSPVLQRKEGYREVLRVWLMFDLAAKLIWKGGDDVYSGGKKDIATLYEYWLFFKLLDLIQSIFDIEPKDISNLIKKTPDGLNLSLKQGKVTALSGVYNSGTRKLNVRFNYNRSFSGKKNYPESGSWTTTLRPDYTLSFWPFGIKEEEAEIQELIVHIHFDAKYKVANFTDFLEKDSDKDLKLEKTENRKGVYKNADLLKMHAYKDAIRRTGGAYVLYPGDMSIERRGFHEIIPGLGAFPVRPSKMDSGIGELKSFILDTVEHFINRASQREKLAFRTFDIYKKPPNSSDELKEALPETYNLNRGLIPDETFVLVGFYSSKEQYNWISKNQLYNFRIGSGRGSIVLNTGTVSAKYLLLHTTGDLYSGDLWKITSDGPKVFSKEDLIRKGYPSPSQENYLILEIEKVNSTEFKDVKWFFKDLKNYKSGRQSAIPFTASLSELMRNILR
ncbi:DUF2357 domain-containing protein [Maribacter sp. MAR_2009_72]|uniref:DUF2357 domain-containing protein n=1 Tax=Maribacter sp. MAR_2009_72 TaxID=1250050 RepID=UPI00119A97AA|nr:DUF2357 domain-containing protein [Maribacter sp. MAR_2009_72]TVZ16095.1 hypothetical protein JM81_2348 [Maribacter sp. MAR_2009_72]